MINKLLITLFFCIFLVSASANGLKLSPLKSQLEIYSERNCSYYWIEPYENIEIKILWSKNKSSISEDYTILGEKMEIAEEIKKIKKGEYQICFEPAHNGIYYGIVWFYQKESLIEMGSWIKLNVYEKESFVLGKMENKINLLSGNSIKKTNKENFILWGILIFLLTTLILLIFFRKK